MADRRRFRIMDLVVAVAAAGVGFGGVAYIEGSDNRSGVVETILLATIAAYAVVAYYVARFVRRRSTQLLILAVALAFASTIIGIYTVLLCIGMGIGVEVVLPVGGLMMVALVLAIGGVVHGLLDHWHGLKNPPAGATLEPHPAPRPLDPEQRP